VAAPDENAQFAGSEHRSSHSQLFLEPTTQPGPGQLARLRSAKPGRSAAALFAFEARLTRLRRSGAKRDLEPTDPQLERRKGRHGDSAGYESPLTAAIFRILAPDPTMPWEESRPMGRWEDSRAPAPGWAHCPDFTAIGGEVGSGRCSLALRCRAILGNISGFRGFSTLQGDRPVLLC